MPEETKKPADANLPSEPPRDSDDLSVFDEAKQDPAGAAPPDESTPDEQRAAPDKPADDFSDAGRDAPSSSPMADWLRSHNFDIDPEATDEDIEEILAATVQRAEAVDPEQFQQAVERNRQLEALLQARQQAPKQEPPEQKPEPEPEKPKALYDPPQVSAAAEQLKSSGLLVRDNNGLWVAVDDKFAARFAAEAAELNQREAYENRFFSGLRQDPASFIGKLAAPFIEEAVKPFQEEIERLKQEFGTQRQATTRQQVEDHFANNAAVYYQVDKDGNLLQDDKGNPLLTVRGRVYAAAEASLRELIPDPGERHNHILRNHIEPLGDLEDVAPQKKPGRKERNKSFLSRISKNNGRDTDLQVNRPARSAPTDTSRLSVREDLDQTWDRLMAEGLANLPQ